MLREFLIEQGATPKAGGIVVNPGVQIRGPYVTPSAAVVSSASILLVEFSRAFGNSVMFFGFICRLYPVKLFETINQFSENHVLVKKKNYNCALTIVIRENLVVCIGR